MLELFASVFMLAAWLVSDHYPPWMTAYSESAMAIGLCCLLAASSRPAADRRSRSVPVIFWWIVAIASIPGCQWLAGQVVYSGDAIVASLYLLGFAVAVLTGCQSAQRHAANSAAWLAGTVLLGATVSAALALFQVFPGVSFGHWLLPICKAGRACANLAQPNNLGTLIGLGVAGLLLLREQRRLGSVTAGVLLVLLLLGAAASQSRTAMLFGPAIMLCWFMARRAGATCQTRLSLMASVTAAHWSLVWFWPVLEQALLLNATAGLGERGVDGGRLQAWTMFVDALSLSPWTGFGWLQTASAQLAVADRHPPLTGVWQHAHNLFLELLIWCGYPLGLLLCGLTIFWFINRATRVKTIEGVIGIASVTVFGIHSMLELPYHYAYFLVPIGLWVGHIEHSLGAEVRRLAALRWIPVVLSLCLLIGVMRDYSEVEEDYRLARFESLRIGTLAAAQAAPDALFLSGLTAQLRLIRTKPVAGMPLADLNAMEAAVKRYPDVASMAKLAWAWALNGRLHDATQMLARIRFVHGDVLYRKVRLDLHQRVQRGESGLIELDAAMPN